MAELICETVAHRAGFAVSVGNWITPDGSLIVGLNYESHHWETLSEYFKTHENFCDQCENNLSCMNLAIDKGFIRLVFRQDVCFQVGAKNIEDLWSEDPSYRIMMSIIERLDDIEVHIFSRDFYVIGQGHFITHKRMDDLQIQIK